MKEYASGKWGAGACIVSMVSSKKKPREAGLFLYLDGIPHFVKWYPYRHSH